MTEDLCRSKFEIWCGVVILSVDKYNKGDRKGKYKRKITQDCWDAWQAAWDSRSKLDKTEEI